MSVLERVGIWRWMRPLKGVGRLIADRRASAAVEFGFLGLLSFTLILEIMQVGLYFYSAFALERATEKSARLILTGALASKNLSADMFRTTVLCPFLPAGLLCSNVITNIVTVAEDVAPAGYYSFVKADKSGVIWPQMDNSKTSFATGTECSYVYAQVFYAMPVVSPVWRAMSSTLWNGGYVHFVSASSVFRNEPYLGGNASNGC